MKKIILILIFVFVILAIFYLYTNWQVGGKSSLSALTKTPSPSPTKNSGRTTLAENLEIPWALDFLPDDRIIFTERWGKIKILSSDEPVTIAIISGVKHVGEGGLLGITVHPDFEKNK